MNRTFIIQSKHLIAHIFVVGILLLAASCKTNDDPTSFKNDTTITEQFYKDVEYASMTSSLSVPRRDIQATTVGVNSYFVSGNDFNSYYSPRNINVIDVFNRETLSWSVESIPSYQSGDFVVAGSKIFFNGPAFRNSDEKPQSKAKSYDFVSKSVKFYDIGSPRFIKKVIVTESKMIFAGATFPSEKQDSSAIDIVGVNSNSLISTMLPNNAKFVDMAIANDKLYFTSINENHKIFVYDLRNNSWTSFDSARSLDYDTYLVATDNKIVIYSKYSAKIYAYDLSTKQWSTTALSQPNVTKDVVATGNKVFFAGGVDNSVVPSLSSDMVEIYDTRSNNISTKGLSQKRTGGGAAVVNGKYVIFAGGYDLSTKPLKLFNTVDFFILNK